jgi:hypothetical protein
MNLFNFFGKKPTALNAAIQMIYGPNPPRKSADVQQAANLVVRIKRLRPSTFGQAIEMIHAVKDSSV